VGKGQRVIANAIHDVSIPPKRWGRPNEADSMGVQILFSDAQTHFSEYRGECSNGRLGLWLLRDSDGRPLLRTVL